MYEEKKLVQSLSQGDEQAFCQLFHLYNQPIGNFVKKFTGSDPSLEELTMDIFLKVWMHREKMADVESFSSYLFTIARNHIYSYLKKRSRELAHRNQWESHNMHLQYNRQNSTATEDEDHYKKMIEHAVSLLSAQQKKVYQLSRHEELSQAGIAARLDISLETVKKHMVLALRNIRQYLLKKKVSSSR